MTITIRGTTARAAWFSVSPGDGRARLHVDVHTGDEPPRGAIARAVLLIGQGPAAQIAAGNAAHHLRKGQRVTVVGAGLAVDGGQLVVCGCTHILHDEAVAA